MPRIVSCTFFSFTLPLFLLCANAGAQTKEDPHRENAEYKRHNSRLGVDLSILPAFLYNSLNTGLSLYTNPSTEHRLAVNLSNHFPGSPTSIINIHYATNFYFSNNKNYVFEWIGIRNAIRDIGYEEGYHPNTLRPHCGIGFGRKMKNTRQFFIRIESGLGIALNFTSSNADQQHFSQIKEYSFDTYYPEYNPRLLPVFLLKFTFGKEFSN